MPGQPPRGFSCGIAGKLAGVLSKQPPMPQHASDVGAEQIRETRRARWAVIAGLVVLSATGGILIGIGAPTVLVQAEEAGPSYASEEE